MLLRFEIKPARGYEAPRLCMLGVTILMGRRDSGSPERAVRRSIAHNTAYEEFVCVTFLWPEELLVVHCVSHQGATVRCAAELEINLLHSFQVVKPSNSIQNARIEVFTPVNCDVGGAIHAHEIVRQVGGSSVGRRRTRIHVCHTSCAGSS